MIDENCLASESANTIFMQTETVILYLFTPGLNEIFKEDECLVDVSPVLAVVIESLPDHLHDLGEGDHVVGEVSNLGHLR